MRDSKQSIINQKLVIYDENCSFCKHLADWALKKISDDFIFVDSKSVKPEDYGLNQNDFDKYVWLIKANSEKSKGALAIAELLKQMEFRWMILGSIILIPPFTFFASGIYWLVAKNRRHFKSVCS
ncbi:MAG: DCC1-like thiol-disulfide oxidoreductase family protein [Acidimicrobiales bacterium]|nr:DCC1-like thiol-disulfide oxidoreductase family protein [Acidimicrobiales bacterium]